MSFEMFMKKNQVKRENVKFRVTKTLCDADGKPLEWELRPVSTAEDRKCKLDAYEEVVVNGKTRRRMNTIKYIDSIVCASVVYPDLHDASLQNSYGVLTPEELLNEMVPISAEYDRLALKVQEISGFMDSLQDDIDEAKN